LKKLFLGFVPEGSARAARPGEDADADAVGAPRMPVISTGGGAFCRRSGETPVFCLHNLHPSRIKSMLTPGYVYILASGFKKLYIGMTSDLEGRVWQHKHGINCAFTEQYNIKQLVYFERYDDIRDAIAREKQLKRWSRVKKVGLIVAVNPAWKDLSEAWGKPTEPFDGKLREPERFV